MTPATLPEYDAAVPPARPAPAFAVHHGPNGLFGVDSTTGEILEGERLALKMSTFLADVSPKCAAATQPAVATDPPVIRLRGAAWREVR